jgi:hypothetical protein
MRSVTPTAARDTVTPTLHKTQEALVDTVLPALRDVLSTARDKGSDLLTSDTAHEARRRGHAVVMAAKGEPAFLTPTRRHWRLGLGMLALGAAFGAAGAWAAKRLSAPVDSYTQPVPSGTDGGTTTVSGNGARKGMATEDVDLRSGAKTTR